MKKITFLLAVILTFGLTSGGIAQTTTPRFGITKNTDNAGRVITYAYSAPAITATTVITPKNYDNLYAINCGTLSPAINFTATSAYLGDRVTFITTATASSTITLGGNVLTSASTYTVASGKYSTITFVFNGANFAEVSRTTNQ